MGFMKDRAKNIKQAMDEGDMDQAAKLAIHALMEGPTTRTEIEADLAEDK